MARVRRLATLAQLTCETLNSVRGDQYEPVYLTESRKRPKYDCNIPAVACTDGDGFACVTITDISDSGLRIEAGKETIEALFGDLDHGDAEAEPEPSLELHFSLPIDSENPAPVKVRCLAIHARQKHDSIYQIGLKFVAFEVGRATLTDYLSLEGLPARQTI